MQLKNKRLSLAIYEDVRVERLNGHYTFHMLIYVEKVCEYDKGYKNTCQCLKFFFY